MGNRPCSSASRSEGLEEWKAPDAMKRMKSGVIMMITVTLVRLVGDSDSGGRVGKVNAWEGSTLGKGSGSDRIGGGVLSVF